MDLLVKIPHRSSLMVCLCKSVNALSLAGINVHYTFADQVLPGKFMETQMRLLLIQFEKLLQGLVAVSSNSMISAELLESLDITLCVYIDL